MLPTSCCRFRVGGCAAPCNTGSDLTQNIHGARACERLMPAPPGLCTAHTSPCAVATTVSAPAAAAASFRSGSSTTCSPPCARAARVGAARAPPGCADGLRVASHPPKEQCASPPGLRAHACLRSPLQAAGRRRALVCERAACIAAPVPPRSRPLPAAPDRAARARLEQRECDRQRQARLEERV